MKETKECQRVEAKICQKLSTHEIHLLRMQRISVFLSGPAKLAKAGPGAANASVELAKFIPTARPATTSNT